MTVIEFPDPHYEQDLGFTLIPESIMQLEPEELIFCLLRMRKHLKKEKELLSKEDYIKAVSTHFQSLFNEAFLSLELLDDDTPEREKAISMLYHYSRLGALIARKYAANEDINIEEEE